MQRHLDLDMGRTFSPTSRPVTLRTLCALSAKFHEWVIGGGDVKVAYPQGKWPEHIKKAISRMPFGYHDRDEMGRQLAAEVGNLYGHPLAGKHWWLTFLEWMLHDGFTQSKHDPCLFFRRHGDKVLYIIVFVDDILTFGSPELRNEWVQRFSKDFRV